VMSDAIGSNWRLMPWTGTEGSTNAWTYSTRRFGAASKDMCLRDVLAVNKNCHGWKNNNAKASKKSNDSEKRCLKADAIDNCKFKRLQEKFVSLREEYQHQHGRAYDDYRAKIEEAIKSDPKTFFLDM
jgi:hypothetical protein